jgi:hypothetical protein
MQYDSIIRGTRVSNDLSFNPITQNPSMALIGVGRRSVHEDIKDKNNKRMWLSAVQFYIKHLASMEKDSETRAAMEEVSNSKNFSKWYESASENNQRYVLKGQTIAEYCESEIKRLEAEDLKTELYLSKLQETGKKIFRIDLDSTTPSTENILKNSKFREIRRIENVSSNEVGALNKTHFSIAGNRNFAKEELFYIKSEKMEDNMLDSNKVSQLVKDIFLNYKINLLDRNQVLIFNCYQGVSRSVTALVMTVAIQEALSKGKSEIKPKELREILEKVSKERFNSKVQEVYQNRLPNMLVQSFVPETMKNNQGKDFRKWNVEKNHSNQNPPENWNEYQDFQNQNAKIFAVEATKILNDIRNNSLNSNIAENDLQTHHAFSVANMHSKTTKRESDLSINTLPNTSYTEKEQGYKGNANLNKGVFLQV